MSHGHKFLRKCVISEPRGLHFSLPIHGVPISLVMLVTLYGSVSEAQPAQQRKMAVLASPAKNYEPFWYTGVSGLNAPNELLNRWSWAEKPDATRSPSAAEIQDALDNDDREIIDFHDVALTDEIRMKLLKLRRVKWLRMAMGVVAADVKWLGEMRQLQGVSLDHGDLRGVDFKSLAPLSQLQWLNLGWAQFSDRDFRSLPAFPKLETLLLTGKSIGDAHLTHLAEIRPPSLSKLSLYYTSVTDEGVEKICRIGRFEYLDLFCSRRVSERSINSLSNQTNLRIIGVGGTGMCRDFSKNAAVERLMELLPNAHVDYGD